jgi:hypothetical protein
MGRLSVSATEGSGTPRYVGRVAVLFAGADLEQKGMIVKWAVLGSLFAFFMLWFIGGYVHAKRRLKAGRPLLGYHRVCQSVILRRSGFL